MTRNTFYKLICVLLLIVVISSCTKIKDLFVPPSPRELYQREFPGNDEDYILWDQAFQRSILERLSIQLPYSETGHFFSEEMQVYSYDTDLRQGEIFHLDIYTDSSDVRLFVDFFKATEDSMNPYEYIKRNDLSDRYFQHRVDETGTYKIIIQPEIKRQSGFSFSAYTLPSYGFPVVGKSNSDIRSFWGASRDGGRRSHEGIDVFAPRGTPVVAVTDGYIRSTGDRGLGGKQVWLRTNLFGSSLYYAHLDSIAVSATDRVNKGDTLGFVGNTGNARTTDPHLHFGIYYNRGAVNPLPYIYQREPFSIPPVVPKWETREISIQSNVANLRLQASLQGERIDQVQQGEILYLMGYADNWRHVQTTGGIRAYVHESLVQ